MLLTPSPGGAAGDRIFPIHKPWAASSAAGNGDLVVIAIKRSRQLESGAVLMRTSPAMYGSTSGVARRYMPPVECPTHTGFNTICTASTRTPGHAWKASSRAIGELTFDPSPGRSTIQMAPGTSMLSANSKRLSEPNPGPPGMSNQLGFPGRCALNRRRTPEGVKHVYTNLFSCPAPKKSIGFSRLAIRGAPTDFEAITPIRYLYGLRHPSSDESGIT